MAAVSMYRGRQNLLVGLKAVSFHEKIPEITIKSSV